MRRNFLKFVVVFVAPLLGCCNKAKTEASAGEVASPKREVRALTLSAIPDQDPEKLQRLYGSLATYLSGAIGSEVQYKPVTDYKAAVTAFKVGDLDLVWFGGLTGVQARIQVPGAEAILQRDIDEKFTSVFIANRKAGISSLTDLKGKTFSFGSESSTSGRLMPQYFLEKAGITLADFKGRPGFSGSHDKTIELVTAGSYDAGVVNAQVWQKRLADRTIDTVKVAEFSTTPPYHDYHWVLHPDAEKRIGGGLKTKLIDAFTALKADNPEHVKILDLFGAKRFIETRNDNYASIEQIGRSTELIVADARR